MTANRLRYSLTFLEQATTATTRCPKLADTINNNALAVQMRCQSYTSGCATNVCPNKHRKRLRVTINSTKNRNKEKHIKSRTPEQCTTHCEQKRNKNTNTQKQQLQHSLNNISRLFEHQHSTIVSGACWRCSKITKWLNLQNSTTMAESYREILYVCTKHAPWSMINVVINQPPRAAVQ